MWVGVGWMVAGKLYMASQKKTGLHPDPLQHVRCCCCSRRRWMPVVRVSPQPPTPKPHPYTQWPHRNPQPLNPIPTPNGLTSPQPPTPKPHPYTQ